MVICFAFQVGGGNMDPKEHSGEKCYVMIS